MKKDDSLDDRSKKILRELVIHYCTTGHPVGSRTLSKKKGVDLSPATIRNVLADLEECEYIMQPHTSAGRIPTDKGYRYYVNNLMKSQHLRSSQKELIEQKIQGEARQFEDLLLLTTQILARMSHNIALAVAPDLERMILESLDFIVINPTRLLAVLVTKGGVVSNKVIDLDEPISKDELGRIANYIRTEFCGQTLPSIRKKIIYLMRQEQVQYNRSLKRAVILGQKSLEHISEREQLLVIGASQIVGYPEFSDANRTRELLEALEQKSRILHILTECIEGEGIHILIGSENGEMSLRDLSLVSSPYRYQNQAIGTLGILGPTRMEYDRMVPLVEHLARVVSTFLSAGDMEFYSRQKPS